MYVLRKSSKFQLNNVFRTFSNEFTYFFALEITSRVVQTDTHTDTDPDTKSYKTAIICCRITSYFSKMMHRHTSQIAQNGISQNSQDFVQKGEWSPNSPELNPLEYHLWGAMLEKCQAYSQKPQNKKELIAILQ